MKTKAGFTLVETLLVLAIVIGLLYFPVQRWQRWQARLEGEYFFQQLERHLISAQQQAISVGRPTDVIVYRSKRNVALRLLTPDNEYYNDDLPMPASVIPSHKTEIKFSGGTGNIGKIQECAFTTTYSDETVVFQFYIGSGRFERK